MEAETERALVAALKRGDASAFDRIYEDFRPRLYSYLVRISRRRDVAEELLQETFLRLATRSAGLADDTRLEPWLFTVARNLYVSHVRARLVEVDRIDRLSFETPAQAPTPFEGAAGAETLARLERALASMPESARDVLLLVGVEGLEPIEAALVMGVSPEALRQRLARARALLKTALAEPEIERNIAKGGRRG